MSYSADQHAGGDDTVRASFTRQAPQFTRPDAIYGSDHLAGWVVSSLGPLDAGMRVLEVACGAGHGAEAVAPHVREVVGLDLTPALVEGGRRRLAERGVANVELRVGDARSLDVAPGSFDVVFCRLAVHHFADVVTPIAEMAKACRPGGVVALLDITVIDPATRDALDALDRLIDPSHTRRRTVDELRELLESHVGPVEAVTSNRSAAPLKGYLATIDATAEVADAVRHAVRDELAGGPPTGWLPAIDGEQITVTNELSALRARRR